MYKIITFLFLLSFNSYASTTIEKENEKIKEFAENLYKDIGDEDLAKKESENIVSILKDISLDQNISEYKKSLKKQFVLLTYNSIYTSDDKEKLNYVIKNMIPLSLCIYYQFQSDQNRVYKELLDKIITSKHYVDKYNLASEYMFSNEIKEKFDVFMNNVLKDPNSLSDNCSIGDK